MFCLGVDHCHNVQFPYVLDDLKEIGMSYNKICHTLDFHPNFS